MALQRAVLPSFNKTFLSVPPNTQPSAFPFSDPCSYHHRPHNRRLRVKCSVNYRDNQPLEFARPAEIPWKKDLCNSVHLIGVVGAPVEIKHLPSGKVLAWTRLAVKKSATDTSWINLTFWDELAQVAFQHVEKGNQIFVAGRLISDVVESDEGKQQTYYKVVVQQLNFIQRSPASTSSYNNNRDADNMTSRKFGNNSNGANSTVPTELWQAFFANPSEWWDNRMNKLKCSCFGYRGTRNIQISSTRIQGSLYGLKGEIIHRGLSHSWQYWMKEWEPLKTTKAGCN